MKPIGTMTTDQIKRELKSFAWEYIALADKAQTQNEYVRGALALDMRNEWLKDELRRREAGGESEK